MRAGPVPLQACCAGATLDAADRQLTPAARSAAGNRRPRPPRGRSRRFALFVVSRRWRLGARRSAENPYALCDDRSRIDAYASVQTLPKQRDDLRRQAQATRQPACAFTQALAARSCAKHASLDEASSPDAIFGVYILGSSSSTATTSRKKIRRESSWERRTGSDEPCYVVETRAQTRFADSEASGRSFHLLRRVRNPKKSAHVRRGARRAVKLYICSTHRRKTCTRSSPRTSFLTSARTSCRHSLSMSTPSRRRRGSFSG